MQRFETDSVDLLAASQLFSRCANGPIRKPVWADWINPCIHVKAMCKTAKMTWIRTNRGDAAGIRDPEAQRTGTAANPTMYPTSPKTMDTPLRAMLHCRCRGMAWFEENNTDGCWE